jgi:hypothetical protein
MLNVNSHKVWKGRGEPSLAPLGRGVTGILRRGSSPQKFAPWLCEPGLDGLREKKL